MVSLYCIVVKSELENKNSLVKVLELVRTPLSRFTLSTAMSMAISASKSQLFSFSSGEPAAKEPPAVSALYSSRHGTCTRRERFWGHADDEWRTAASSLLRTSAMAALKDIMNTVQRRLMVVKLAMNGLLLLLCRWWYRAIAHHGMRLSQCTVSEASCLTATTKRGFYMYALDLILFSHSQIMAWASQRFTVRKN